MGIPKVMLCLQTNMLCFQMMRRNLILVASESTAVAIVVHLGSSGCSLDERSHGSGHILGLRSAIVGHDRKFDWFSLLQKDFKR